MEQMHRIEKDSLGEVQVPISALYGAQTQRAVDNFPISGLKPWFTFVESTALVKKCAALVNADLRLLDQEIANAIAQAADEVINGQWNDQFVVDPFQAGAGTSHNMNLNEVLATRAAQILAQPGRVHPNDDVNMAQSTNDVIPTAIRIGCILRLKEICCALDNLENSLRQKSIAFMPIVKSGRTHLQDAVPVTLGQEFAAYADAVKKDCTRILFAARDVRELGIGGTATGSGLNAHPQYHVAMVEKITFFSGETFTTSENLFERMQSMADLAAFSGALRTATVTLTRIANDFRLLASGPSTGLDELRLPALQPGSSIMPGKVNPVMAEMLNMAMFHCMGCDTTVNLAAQAGQLELNVMMPIIAHNLFEMIQVFCGSVRAFDEKCVRGLTANSEKCSEWLSRNAIIITALNPLIGYQAGAELVKRALDEKQPITKVAAEEAQAGKLKHKDNGRIITVTEITATFSDLGKMCGEGIL